MWRIKNYLLLVKNRPFPDDTFLFPWRPIVVDQSFLSQINMFSYIKPILILATSLNACYGTDKTCVNIGMFYISSPWTLQLFNKSSDIWVISDASELTQELYLQKFSSLAELTITFLPLKERWYLKYVERISGNYSRLNPKLPLSLERFEGDLL